MRTQNFVDQYNAYLVTLNPRNLAQEREDDFQAAYFERLKRYEQKFDDLTEQLEVVDIFAARKTIYRAINMGDYILGGSVQTVIAQPVRKLIYKGVRGKNRTGRKIELFNPDKEALAAIGRVSLLGYKDQMIGSVMIDSSRVRALPSSYGLLENFSELLDEVDIRADAEKSQQS
jgi:hypothetical protein